MYCIKLPSYERFTKNTLTKALIIQRLLTNGIDTM